MQRSGILAAGFFLLVACYWVVLMIAALVTSSGDYKFDTIMSILFVIASLQALILARRS